WPALCSRCTTAPAGPEILSRSPAEPFQPIHAHYQNVLYAAVLQLGLHAQPELGAFVAAAPKPQHILDSSKSMRSRRTLADFHPSFVPHFHVQRIQVHHAIGRL